MATEVFRSSVLYPTVPTLGGAIYATDGPLASTAVGTSGQVLTSQGAAAPVWATPASPGVGTVTSVAMSVPTGLTIGGSPVTSAGTLAVTLTSGYVIPGGGSAGHVLTSNGAAAPTFQAIPAVSSAALTRVDDTNVTLTLGGTPGSALLQATSITAGWIGQLGLTRGGTAASLTAVNGGVVYSTASALAVTLAGTSGKVLTSAGAASPTWETPTTGTVTSIALSVPTGLSISGSPITTSGTLAVTLTAGYVIPGGGSAGQYLQSAGASAPAFSTATLPSTATGTGTILRADGTNWAASTATYPDTVTSGNVMVASGSNVWAGQAPAAITRTDDTNVTLTLGGSATTALVNAASLTLGWTGQLGLTRGGTAASLTASNGGLIYSTASALAVLAAGSSGQIPRSGGAGAPTWSTATFPATATTAGAYLRADGTNWIMSTLTLPNAASSGDILVASGANTIGAQAPAALTRTSDTNVVLTLGGSATTALVNAASITASWSGTLAGSRGGTGYGSLKLAGVTYGLSTNYIDGTGTAGSDGTAQTVKTIAIAANTLTQVGDRLQIRVFFRGDTGAAGVVGTATVNAVSVCSVTTGTGTQSAYFDIWLAYIDATHANITSTNGTTGGVVTFNTGLSVANTAGFDWANSQNLNLDQTAVANNHIVVFELTGTVYPKGVVLG